MLAAVNICDYHRPYGITYVRQHDQPSRAPASGGLVRQLNQQLGVSHNLLNRRFGSKEQLWRATVDRWIGEVVAELAAEIPDDEGDPLETLRRLIVRYIDVQARRPELARLMNIESSIDGPRLRYLFDQFIEIGRAHV